MKELENDIANWCFLKYWMKFVSLQRNDEKLISKKKWELTEFQIFTKLMELY